jgi:hypothetical protein
MGAVILEPPARVAPAPDDLLVEEQLLLELAQLRQVPDWEGLMAMGTTPALLVGGERRTRPR